MHLFSMAFDAMNSVDTEGLSIDQQPKVAEIMALLSISQELSQIHQDGIGVAGQR